MNSFSRLIRYMNAKRRVLLVGPPGIGKTERIRAIAHACNRKLITRRFSLMERVDLAGAIAPDFEAGVAKSLPLDLMQYLKTVDEPTLFFADDLGQAPLDVQAAFMLCFDEGELSPNVLIWGATNRPGDKAAVTALCEPLRSRFHLAFAIPVPETTKEMVEESATGAEYIGTWKEEVEAWCNWALDYGCHGEIIAWQRSTTGRTLYQWRPHADPAVRMPDFRSWHTVIDLYKAGIKDMKSISAAVGKPVAVEFTAFAALTSKLPTPDQVWMDPDGAMVPTDPGALYLITSMLAAAVTPEFAEPLVKYLVRLPRVYAALLGRDTFRRIGGAMSGTKAWVRWFTENQELFTSD